MVAMLLLLPVALALYIRYRASEFRYFAGETTFEGLRFASDLGAGSVIWIYLSYWLANFGVLLAIILTVGVGVGVASTSIPGLTGDDPGALPPNSGVGVIAGLLAMLLYLMLNGVLHVILVLRRLVMRICESLKISGEVDFERIKQSPLAGPGRGEGLADALDVGGV